MGIRELFERIPGQARLAGELEMHLGSPKNSYFIIGARDAGAIVAAKAFAQALLCEDRGCGRCKSCRAIERGVHPDVSVFERTGAFLSVDDAKEITGLAFRSTSGSRYRIIIVPELELVERAAPVLLKTVEEPPESTIFILLASMELPELGTLMSRSVVLRYDRLSDEQINDELVKRGAAPDDSADAVRLSAGHWPRAVELAADHELREAFSLWEQLPHLLKQDLSVIIRLADRLIAVGGLMEDRKKREQRDELEELDELLSTQGLAGSAMREKVEERHRRELRKVRTTELRAGLAVLERHYRNQLVDGEIETLEPSVSIRAIRLIEDSQSALARNSNEFLLLVALLSRLADKSS